MCAHIKALYTVCTVATAMHQRLNFGEIAGGMEAMC